MKEDGSFDEMAVNGKAYKGRALMDFIDKQVKSIFPTDQDQIRRRRPAVIFICGILSRANLCFQENKMIYSTWLFVEDKEASRERMNPYYKLSVQENTAT